MANDYRILDERDKNIFQAGNKLNVTEIGNKVTYEHVGNPPEKLPLKEQILEYGESFDITVPSVYDSTGHVKSETTYSFIMPEETDTSSFLTKDNFNADEPISVYKRNGNITYSHDKVSQPADITEGPTNLEYGKDFSFSVLSGADVYGHANQTTTYKFKMPKETDTSRFLTEDSFEEDTSITVTKNENNNTIKCSHNKVGTDSETSGPVNLNYDTEFSFIALSDRDEYGHAKKKTTYKFKMPAAPSAPPVNTSEFLKINDFEAGNLISVTKDTDNNTITYSHGSVTKSNDLKITLAPDYGETASFTVFSDTNSDGHVEQKTTYTLEMPKKSEIKTFDINKTQVSTTYRYNMTIVSGQTIEKSDKYWIVISPNLNGYRKEGTNSATGAIVSVLQAIAFGSSIFFTTVGTSTFYIPLLLTNIKQGDSTGDNTAELITPLKIKTEIIESGENCKISITIYCTNDYSPLSNFIDNIMVIPY